MKRNFLAFFVVVVSFITDGLAKVANEWQMNYQPAASPVMQKVNEVHDLLMIVITITAILVAALLFYTVYRYRASRNPEPSKVTHHTLLEIIWTLIPVLVLIVIGIPSIKLLYFADKVEKADMTIVAVGHQWYWTYEYPDEEVEFESYMIKDEDIKPGQYRLLSVDNPVYIPVGATVKVLVKSEDVIHSFAIPAFGMKLDAVPGRTNETWFRVDKEGRYYGQCSELCGKDHGYMPIEINVVSKENYQGWLKQNNAKSTRPKPKIIETKATIDTADNPTESNNVAEATSTKQAATTKNSNAPIKGVDSTKQEVISKSGKKAG